MKYTLLASKSSIAMAFVINCFMSIALAYLLTISVDARKFENAVIIISAMAVHLPWFLFSVNKFVHAKIDNESQVLFFGNMFFNNEVSINNVRYVGKYLFFSRIIKVRIERKTFLINSVVSNPEKVFKNIEN